MWAYLLNSVFLVLSIQFFFWAVIKSHKENFEFDGVVLSGSILLGVLLGGLSLFHQNILPYENKQVILGAVGGLGILLYYQIWRLKTPTKIASLSISVSLILVVLQELAFEISLGFHQENSVLIKDFISWVKPLVYAVAFSFMGVVTRYLKEKKLLIWLEQMCDNQLSHQNRLGKRLTFMRILCLIPGVLFIFFEFNVLSSWALNKGVWRDWVLVQSTLVPFLVMGGIIFIYGLQKRRSDNQGMTESARQLEVYSTLLNELSYEEETYRRAIDDLLLTIEENIDSNSFENMDIFDKDFDKVIRYFDEEAYRFLMSLLPLKHKALKGVIVSKYDYIKENDITFELSIGNSLDTLSIPPVDLTRMVGILLDNALEAAAESKGKHVVLVISEDENQKILIEVRNTMLTPPDLGRIYKAGYSSKGSGRGQGLSSFKSLVKKHKNIDMRLRVEKAHFVHGISIGILKRGCCKIHPHFNVRNKASHIHTYEDIECCETHTISKPQP